MHIKTNANNMYQFSLNSMQHMIASFCIGKVDFIDNRKNNPWEC